MRALITGSAGFIGFHIARRLLQEGYAVAGVDGFTPYYDQGLKEARHDLLKGLPGFIEHRLMLEDEEGLTAVWEDFEPEVVIHLAAQAGVRYSLENPRAYIDSNIVGTFNLFEVARKFPPQHLLLASTSSLYGVNTGAPAAENSPTDFPLTLYAATKKASESMAHAYSHLWKIPVTTFRFFTVYGPWGRPDMAYFKFVDAIENGEPIDIFNNGAMSRDFTFIDDLVEAVWRLIPRPPGTGDHPLEGDTLSQVAPYRVVNIGRAEPVELLEFIEQIERALGKSAIKNLLPMQPGDVPATFANTDLLARLTDYRPSTSTQQGIEAFVDWFREYRGMD